MASASNSIEIEILKLKLFTTCTVCAGFFTKSRMCRLLSLGPPNYAIQGTYKSRLDR
jgi:hypothetical protein